MDMYRLWRVLKGLFHRGRCQIITLGKTDYPRISGNIMLHTCLTFQVIAVRVNTESCLQEVHLRLWRNSDRLLEDGWYEVSSGPSYTLSINFEVIPGSF